MGAGYALHTGYAVVPHHLCAPLPENVGFEEGAYGHLAATALHAVRRARPELGEIFSVVGLGLVGQLTARLLQLAGCDVIGWDTLTPRLRTARRLGIKHTLNPAGEDPVAATLDVTGPQGLDGAVLAFGGDAGAVYEKILACLKRSPDGHPMGRIVVVGGARLAIPWMPANYDVRMASRTGPGYHDEAWEYGTDYPPVFMRWTTRTNLELCLRMMSDKRLNVKVLTTHRIPLAEADERIAALLPRAERVLGVVFTM
jgi:threonine dehydrogenase-like Zn-dependent dehydrogenase